MGGMKSCVATRAAPMPAANARPPASLYLAGPFSMGYVDFFTFLMPLYGLSLGLDASEIGVLVGARSILALFLSIHIGVLMDRFGTRAVTLVFVWTGMVLAPLRPTYRGDVAHAKNAPSWGGSGRGQRTSIGVDQRKSHLAWPRRAAAHRAG
jgi:MFS family permease